MGDDYSMGSALDLAGRAQELAQSQNQAAEQAKGSVQQAQGTGSADKKAAWIKAQSAKIQAARAQIDVKQAGAERGFALTKTLINWGFKQIGNTASAISDRMSNADRARALVESGAGAASRLRAGGAHSVTLGGSGDINARMESLRNDMTRLREGGATMPEAQRTQLQERIGKQIGDLQRSGSLAQAGVMNFAVQRELVDMRRELLNHRLQGLQQDGSIPPEHQELAGNLRDEIFNLQRQSELLAGMEITRGAFANLGSVQLYAGAQHFEGDDNRGQAAMGTWLRSQGADERLLNQMQQLSQLQEDANDLRDERFRMSGGSNERNRSGMDQHQQVTTTAVQQTLDTILEDQQTMRQLGAATAFVDAMDEFERLQNAPGTDPAELAAAGARVAGAEWDFNASRDTKWQDSWLAKTASSTLGDAFQIFQQLQQLNKSYRDAQAQLSAASEQAGDAMEQARDMELS